ncbi:deazaflavin-dependent oxidoreductase (nitroreductase family) [Kribbella amoyensis]|uniref:Deazaflavin-dependent oxidoreductase (Nitroreductase family) n=2 Tax=Kribbella amoyensis TaxID=996641 RepID=A0A561BUP9_9ACTN|nr:deazaflavin-dependent oxidoreductase (nitroreductase family) [Kribbella amoyensis]
MYRGGRAGAVARILNRLSAKLYAAGLLLPSHAVTLEVTGRHTGRPVRLPVAITEYDGARYVVSMLGPDAHWVRNVRAAGGQVALHRRGRTAARLEEVPPADRAPILRQYLAVAPGARPHFPVDRRAPLTAFEEIAGQYPVFRILI